MDNDIDQRVKKRELLDFSVWEDIFRHKVNRGELLPWTDSYRLTPSECSTITSSIAQFELGENAQGRSFRAAAKRHVQKSGDQAYLTALELFIQEEQRHSSYLRRFMQAQGLPLEPSHWVDDSFRRLRKLAGLELFIMVLLTGEIVAVPYYNSLQVATQSPLLKAICREILRDEADHLCFQGNALRKIRSTQGKVQRQATEALHHLLMMGTALVVWIHHHRVLRRGGFTLAGFTKRCLGLLHKLNLLARQPLPDSRPTTPAASIPTTGPCLPPNALLRSSPADGSPEPDPPPMPRRPPTPSSSPALEELSAPDAPCRSAPA